MPFNENSDSGASTALLRAAKKGLGHYDNDIR